MLQRKSIQRAALNALDKYQIRVGNITHPIRTLSGGNQQKVVVARELEANPEVIIAAHPTRGLDIHAAEFVHTRLIYARNRGKAVLLVSSELDELLHLSDRIAVMYDGKIVGICKTYRNQQAGIRCLDARIESKNIAACCRSELCSRSTIIPHTNNYRNIYLTFMKPHQQREHHTGEKMIIDSHTHAWPRWPYQPPVPDDESRGKIEQLLHEMDLA